MKKTLLFILLCLSVHTSTAQFRRAAYWHHSVGLCFWDRSQVSNLTPPTTLPKEIAAYNAARGYTGSAAVSMTESYFPGPEGVVNDNNWYRWVAVFTGTDTYGQTIDYSNPVIIVKTCYLSPQGMKSIDSIEAYKTHIRSIVSVMKNHPNNFFVLWTDYPAPTDGHSDRVGWSNTFSTWMKQTLATGNDSFGPFPPNIHVFDIFHKLASPVDGFCDSVYGSWDEGPGGDHPSNLAVALVDSAIVRETFDAAIAYEESLGSAPTLASVKAFLQGPSLGSSMSTALNANGVLASHFTSTPIPGRAVDSINIEIRDSLLPAKAHIRQFAPAWLLADGSILAFPDTTKNYVGFSGAPAGSYYIVVRHRNHLAIMSSAPISLGVSAPPTAYDFSTGQAQAYGTNAMILAGTHYALISGNASNADDIINALDRVATRNNLGASDYNPADLNLDGVVNALDRVVARNNLGQSSQVP